MPRKHYTAAEVATLIARYPHERTDDIARDLHRPIESVYRKAHSLGLHKSPAYLASPDAGRNNLKKGAGTRFPAGHTPWNTGMKGWHAGGRSAETQFKRGEMSGAARAKYKPIGSTRISKDGYLERKVTDDPTMYPARRWTAVHRLVWEAACGPIPAGHIIVFRPGTATAVESEITVDKLELISRAENMARNTVHNYPQPIPQLVQLRGALIRSINYRRKKHGNRNGE